MCLFLTIYKGHERFAQKQLLRGPQDIILVSLDRFFALRKRTDKLIFSQLVADISFASRVMAEVHNVLTYT